MKKFFLLLLFFSQLATSQKQIQGIVIDSQTKEPLPFATVITNSNSGTLTDINGKFKITSQIAFKSINISYVGYKTTSVFINPNDTYINVKLKQNIENLKEIVVTAAENPALKIIRNAIANRNKNNIETALNSFQFNAYNKILITAHPDSIDGKIDSLFIMKDGQKRLLKLDSSNFKFKREIVKQHLYIAEKVSEYKFEKGKKTKEVILATRMAGLQQPIYEALGITLQDFSFYNNKYTIAGTTYINPIAKNALKHYYYKILDTVHNQKAHSYLIHFRPKEKIKTAGLQGVLYLDTNSYAITKAIVELKGIVNVKVSQNYMYLPAIKNWFPSNGKIVIRKGNNNKNVSLFGGVIKVSKSKQNDSIIKTSKRDESDITYFSSETYNSNFKVNIPIQVKKNAATISFAENAHKRSEKFWNVYRKDSLSQRGITAYKKIDSIAKSENVEKKILIARNILNGYYPTEYFNINLGKVIGFNNYEGFRVGFGGETNGNFSSQFKLNSYIAYGTKDTDIKYSFGASIRLNKINNTWLGTNYTNDLQEAAALNLNTKNNSFTLLNPQNINNSKFFNYKTYSVFLKHDFQPNFESVFELSTGNYKPVFNYSYWHNNNFYNTYKLTTASLGFQFHPNSEYMYTPLGKIRSKNAFPQVNFQFTKSFKNIFNSDLNFTQFKAKVLHKIKHYKKGTTTILIEAGLTNGDTPISHLFNATPNYNFQHPWIKRITLASNNSFETMGFNEFISDKFTALHISHTFKSFKIAKRFHPQLIIINKMAFGNIKNSEKHTQITFKSMQHGYYESGLKLNGLFKGFGIGIFYRYGPYSKPLWNDNFALKLTYKLMLGI